MQNFWANSPQAMDVNTIAPSDSDAWCDDSAYCEESPAPPDGEDLPLDYLSKGKGQKGKGKGKGKDGKATAARARASSTRVPSSSSRVTVDTAGTGGIRKPTAGRGSVLSAVAPWTSALPVSPRRTRRAWRVR